MLVALKYRIVALVFATLIVLQFQAPFVVFKMQQWHLKSEIKQQIKAGVPETDLIQLKIAKFLEVQRNTRFEREHEREFKFDGEWYDVIKSEDLGDTTLYYCIHDVKEGRLFAQLDQMTQRVMLSEETEEKRTQIISWLSLEYEYKNMRESWFRYSQPCISTQLSSQIIDRSLTPSTPPPNFIG